MRWRVLGDAASRKARRSGVGALFAALFVVLTIGALAPLGSTAARASEAAQKIPRTAVTTKPCSGRHWISTWATAPSDSLSIGDLGLRPNFSMADQSFRMMVTPHRGGSKVRVRLTNRFGNGPVTFTKVNVANQAKGAAVRAGSLRPVRFGGKRAITIPAGQDAVSDPVRLRIKAFRPVAISYYVPGSTMLPTEHVNANQTSYFTPAFSGDHADSPSGEAFSQEITSWYWVSGLDVRAPERVGTLVAFGDSITDGYVTDSLALAPQSTVQIDQNVRYPDFLQRRLDTAGLPLTTVDMGISGNRVLQHGVIPLFGPSGVSRIGNDAVNITGVTNAIILEGINDLGIPPWPSVKEMKQGYIAMIKALKRRNINVLIGTIMPSGSALLDGPLTSPDVEEKRTKINAWIRSQSYSDAVVDFDKAMRDPLKPENLNPAYADGDYLHPTPAGYKAMAAAVPLKKLASGCSATQSITGTPAPLVPAVDYNSTLSQVQASLKALSMADPTDLLSANTLATMLTALTALGALGLA